MHEETSSSALREPGGQDQAGKPRLHWLHWPKVVALLAVLFLSLSLATFPSALPWEVDGHGHEADSSLSLVLTHAQQNGLQFGIDHVYTYGPLGFLIFFQYSPDYPMLHMVADLTLALIAATGLVLIAMRLSLLWRLLLPCGFVFIAANTFPRTDLVIDTGLLCFGLLCFLEHGRRLLICGIILTLLAAFAALAKNSFLFVATLSLGIVVMDLFIRKQIRLGLAMVIGFAVCFATGWILAGQRLGNLPEFLGNALVMVRGYNGALGWEETLTVRWLLPVLGFLLLSLLIAGSFTAFESRNKASSIRRVLLLGWAALLSLAAWKHGVVRVYSCNILMLLGFIVLLGAGLQVLPRPSRLQARIVAGLGLVCVILSAAIAQMTFLPPLAHSTSAPFRSAFQNLKKALKPFGYEERMGRVVEENRRNAQLPRLKRMIGNATVDVFGRRQAYAIYNGLNYRPRPLPQSYAVANAELMQINEAYYRSADAPQFVLFELLPLDRKLPPLEDARVLLHLLINYEYVAREGPFLLLSKKQDEPADLQLLKAADATLGERIPLDDLEPGPLWLQIRMEPSWQGRIRQFLLRPPAVRLSVWNGEDLLFRSRAPASMLSGGFLVRPFVKKTGDVLNLLTGGDVLHPTACAVEVLKGQEVYWRNELKVEIYRVQNAFSKTAINGEPQAAQSLTVFRSTRWRPEQPPAGNFQEQLAFGFMLVLPLLIGWALWRLARFIKAKPTPTGWRELLAGNTLVLLLLLSVALLAGEIYFRFIYDTTDSLAYTRVSERWVQRHWHVNAAGIRDNIEYTARKPAGKPRITFVGDSFTAGHGIKDVEDRFANQLRQAKPEWEVHVLANVGLDTASELVLLNRMAAKNYQLDHVVLVYCLNDIGDLLPTGGMDAAQAAAGYANRSWILRNSYVLNFLYHRYQAARMGYAKKYFPTIQAGYTGATWEQQKSRLTALRDAVHAQGGKLSAVTFPFLHDLDNEYEYESVHQNLDQLWKSLGVPHLDLLPVFRGIPPERLTVNPYDAHPNEHASTLAAEALKDFLSGIITKP